MVWNARRWCPLVVFVGVSVLVAGCTAPEPEFVDPLTAYRDPSERLNYRVEAAGQAWDAVEEGSADREGTRSALKSIIWSSSAPFELRQAGLAALLRDQDPEGVNDTKRVMGLMVMRERDERMVAFISSQIAAKGWGELTPSLVRSWSRVLGEPGDSRPEPQAIAALHPGIPLDEVVFRVFLDPRVERGPYQIRWDERTRADAWDLLSRLDPSGERRWSLITGGDAAVAAAGGAEIVNHLRAAAVDLRCLPQTSEELRWLTSLRDPSDRLNAEWWRRVARTLDGLTDEQRRGVQLRHAEPIRWASANRPEWLQRSRSDLAAELDARLQERRRFRRQNFAVGGQRSSTERLEEALPAMVWADLLAALVVDDALQTRGLPASVFEYTELDREDRTTEYGGILEATELGAEPFRIALYPPRASARTSDEAFVASEDMMNASDRALAHFHLQVQRTQLRQFAGPSTGDLAYAARSGRLCVVFTSLDRDRLNVDYYQPDGVVLDLGVIERPEATEAADAG
ncbi:MAG: hypothetical protein AAGG07_05440 [Planctomycetota bacterium]